MADVNALSLKGSAIRSIQSGETVSAASTVNVTINAVDVAKTIFVLHVDDQRINCYLSNSTTVTIAPSAVTRKLWWQVVEFY